MCTEKLMHLQTRRRMITLTTILRLGCLLPAPIASDIAGRAIYAEELERWLEIVFQYDQCISVRRFRSAPKYTIPYFELLWLEPTEVQQAPPRTRRVPKKVLLRDVVPREDRRDWRQFQPRDKLRRGK